MTWEQIHRKKMYQIEKRYNVEGKELNLLWSTRGAGGGMGKF
jgi:hypothetical protein